MITDLPGQAIYDAYHKLPASKLWIHNTYGLKEEMHVATYLRSVENMPELELKALQYCKGKVLDIGAGAGSHALALQQAGIDVTALELSPKACEVMAHRGVKKIIQHDIFNFGDHKYDTLLLLMNGIGLTGTLKGLETFLCHAQTILQPGGQLLFNSSDVSYLYDGDTGSMEHYYGEIRYQYAYKRQKTGWFKWLYVDQVTLAKLASPLGWRIDVLFEDDMDQYLAQLIYEPTN